MSYEAWGEPDEAHDGCFTEEQVKEHEQDARDKEREGIAHYFEHLSRVEMGAIDLTGTPSRDLYAIIASWVRNKLDVKWAEEVRANTPDRGP